MTNMGLGVGWNQSEGKVHPSVLCTMQVMLVVKNPPANAGNPGDLDLIPGSKRSPGEGNGYPLQYSCLENSMDRGAWCATVPGVTASWDMIEGLTLSLLKGLVTLWNPKLYN